MKKLALVAFVSALLLPCMVKGQETTGTVDINNVQCQKYVSSSWRNNWFLQVGAGMDLLFAENDNVLKDAKRQVTMAFNIGAGRWMSPYLGFRFSALGGKIKWDSYDISKGYYAGLNFDIMWDMFNSINGMNTKRVFSIVPFVGLGAAYSWDLQGESVDIYGSNGLRHNAWTMPISAGLQFRFRLSQYVDFFVEGRLQLMGDNFNGVEYEIPVDMNSSAIAGFNFNFGGKKFQTANPCDYISYINQLNDQVNNLRGQLGAASSALVAAEAQLPCPEVKQITCPEGVAPMLTVVRFTINSAKISKEEMVNVYNVAEWLKANPNTKITVSGYADKNTGTSQYNKTLSEKRAKAVSSQLVKYGVNKDNITIDSYGSTVQPYADHNNWNRIVLFTIDK